MPPKKKRISSLTKSLRKSPTPDKDQWIDKYAPKQLSDVAIHARKLTDVRQVLKEMIDGSGCKILVLSGPAGSSKSTVAKWLAMDLVDDRGGQTPYVEWINPMDSNMSQFGEFLETTKFRTGLQKTVVIVEDLPNVFHEQTKDQFRQGLMAWAHSSQTLPPLVICLTECDVSNEETVHRGYSLENNFNAETVLGKKLLDTPSLTRIKFNPVNATLVKKALNNIVRNESVFSTIPKETTKQQIARIGNFGDIRSAIYALQFWAKWYSKDDTMGLCMGKESSISVFHAIGKCVYGTKAVGEDDNTTMNQVMRDYSTRSGLLKLGLLENYTGLNKSQFPLGNAAQIIEGLSIADVLTNNVESLEIATRAVRTNLDGLKSSAHSAGLVFPREWRVNRTAAGVRKDVDRYTELEFRKRGVFRSFEDSNMLFGSLEPIINSQKQFKQRARAAHLKAMNQKVTKMESIGIQDRLGGPFRQILGSTEIIADDDYENNVKYFNEQMQSSDSGSEFDDDPITDSEGDDITGDETFEKELIEASQKKRTFTKADLLDDMDDDFDTSDF